MYKSYAQSPDPKNPVLTRFNEKGEWIAFDDLSTEERSKAPSDDFRAHAPNAPLDPISAAYIAGIKASGLSDDKFRFIDFRFGNSAYNAVVAALLSKQENSTAFYSGESISYAEIAYFIFNTYAFEVGNMCNRDKKFLNRISEQQNLVGAAVITEDKIKAVHDINKQTKQQTLAFGTERDAELIAIKISARLALLKRRLRAPKLLSWSSPGQKESGDSAGVVAPTVVAGELKKPGPKAQV
jgi:hypothetical protein